MRDLLVMWKNPKMVAIVAITALLYFGSLFPFRGLTAFGGYADFGRVGVGIPVAFSFLFGPAAAWGAAIGTVLRDIAEAQLDASSVFGFFGNLILGYLPFKLWGMLTKEKPDLRSVKKLLLFMGSGVLACAVCGLTIGWGLFWLGFTPFMPTAAIIALTNALWVITVGTAVLALSYNFVSNHKLRYQDILKPDQPQENDEKSKKATVLALVAVSVCCFLLGTAFEFSPLMLLPFIAVTLALTVTAMR